ncbi:MAG TPA: hypothetical protein PKV96_03725 [Candidatus Saccharimonas sp.]|nr:hypothetical protein [Candidatus Saccharimonas sp.]
MLYTLPTPTWVRSDNQLLPKWRRFVERHAALCSSAEIKQLEEAVVSYEEGVATYTRALKDTEASAAQYAQELTLLQNTAKLTDQELMAHYQDILASPHVIGTRLGSLGELVILIDPVLEGTTCDPGFYELDHRLRFNGYNDYNVQAITTSRRLVQVYSGYRNCRQHSAGEFTLTLFGMDISTDQRAQMARGNFVAAIDALLESVRTTTLFTHLSDKTADRKIPWSGHSVPNPTSAMRRLVDLTASATTNARIRDLTEELSYLNERKRDYLAEIRNYRKLLRDKKAELAQLEAAKQTRVVDETEMQQTLRYISMLPGVIAIRFDQYGTPILHLRCSFTYKGKRYDLGDYELYLEMEERHWGTVLKVRQTRTAAGGDYTRGWHVEYNGFCFGGSRRDQIYSAFIAGDFYHAINLAVGTLNALSEGDERLVRDRFFVEVPDRVWKRKPRPRARRKPRETAAA